jgi:hypothetical protein
MLRRESMLRQTPWAEVAPACSSWQILAENLELNRRTACLRQANSYNFKVEEVK